MLETLLPNLGQLSYYPGNGNYTYIPMLHPLTPYLAGLGPTHVVMSLISMNKRLHYNNSEENILEQGTQELSPHWPWLRLLIKNAILFQFNFIGCSQREGRPNKNYETKSIMGLKNMVYYPQISIVIL